MNLSDQLTRMKLAGVFCGSVVATLAVTGGLDLSAAQVALGGGAAAAAGGYYHVAQRLV